MIVAGIPAPETTRSLTLVAEAAETATTGLAAAARSTDRLRRGVRAVLITRELRGLTAHQVWGRYYVRGTSHEYAEPNAFDDYLRILNTVPGENGAVARNAFIRGWAEHRATGAAEQPVWHRFIGHTAIQVHPEVTR